MPKKRGILCQSLRFFINTNGLIREYLPKGIDFREVRNDDVLWIAERLNNRPRKCLGFRTPKEAFFNLPVAFGLTI